MWVKCKKVIKKIFPFVAPTKKFVRDFIKYAQVEYPEELEDLLAGKYVEKEIHEKFDSVIEELGDNYALLEKVIDVTESDDYKNGGTVAGRNIIVMSIIMRFKI